MGGKRSHETSSSNGIKTGGAKRRARVSTSAEGGGQKRRRDSTSIRLSRAPNGLLQVIDVNIASPSAGAGSPEIDYESAHGEHSQSPVRVDESQETAAQEDEVLVTPLSTPLTLHLSPTQEDTPTTHSPPSPHQPTSQQEREEINLSHCWLCHESMCVTGFPSKVVAARHLRDNHTQSEYRGKESELRLLGIKLCTTCRTPWAVSKSGSIRTHDCSKHT